MSAYTVLHGRRSLQMATHRLLIPAAEVGAFKSAVQCAQALTTLFDDERTRVGAALKEAQERGFEQGRKDAEQATTEALTAAVAKMDQALQAQQRAARDAVATLALAVVHKLSESLGAAQVVPALIEQAVTDLMPLQATRVRVSPELLESTRACLAQQGLGVEVRVDETLSSFDCVLESLQGQNVVGLATQLAAIGQALGVSPSVDIEVS